MCKFYQGAEDKKLEASLKSMFDKVYREKPDSSRKVGTIPHDLPIDTIAVLGRLTPLQESREAYFVALRRKKAKTYEE